MKFVMFTGIERKRREGIGDFKKLKLMEIIKMRNNLNKS